jgi:hypothetical protein
MGPLPFPLIDGCRTRRVAGLIGVVWVLSVADLLFTLWAHFFTSFHEMNPVANYMLSRGLVPSLILFKVVVTAIGVQIFWRLRAHAQAELALWAMAGVYVMLTLRWSNYTLAAV